MTDEEYRTHTPRQVSEMLARIIDRKTGYKRTEMAQLSSFTEKQEEKIRKAKEARLAKKQG